MEPLKHTRFCVSFLREAMVNASLSSAPELKISFGLSLGADRDGQGEGDVLRAGQVFAHPAQGSRM